MERGAKAEKNRGNLKWWQLSLLGVASTIGTGYFLGSALGIRLGGPAFVLSIGIAAAATYFVFDVLARMTAADPEEGSFRTYAKQAYGRWAGFSTGWMYWCSEVLIMGSQMTALAIFTRFWFPGVPMWLCALGYAVLGLGVIWIGNKAFDRLETLLACIKVAAIIMFLIIAAAAWLGWLRGGSRPALPANWHDFYPTGAKGVWASLIFAFYTFGGIEVMGLMALRLRKPNEAPRAGKVMILLLSVIYILSIGMVVMMMSWHQFSADRSPFVAVLDSYHLPFVPHVFNAVLIVAGFSTMVASLYAVTTMLVTLSEDHDAPRIFAITKRERKVPIYALSLTAGGLCISIVLSLLIPGKIYEYLTTAAGLMLLYNWLFILLSAGRMIKFTTWGQFKRFTAMLLIILAVSGTAVQRSSRPGMFISLGFLLAIGLIVLMMNALWKKNDRKRSSRLPQHNE